MSKPFYNVAIGGVFTDEGTDAPTKAIEDATRQLDQLLYAGNHFAPVTVVVSEADEHDVQHTPQALQAYERIRSVLMLAYPNPRGMGDTTCFDLRVADLLADVMHFCTVDGLTFDDRLVAQARELYNEQADPTEDDVRGG